MKVKSLFGSGTQFGIDDIVVAAFMTNFFMQIILSLNFLPSWNMAFDSVAYPIHSLRNRSVSPTESAWMPGVPREGNGLSNNG